MIFAFIVQVHKNGNSIENARSHFSIIISSYLIYVCTLLIEDSLEINYRIMWKSCIFMATSLHAFTWGGYSARRDAISLYVLLLYKLSLQNQINYSKTCDLIWSYHLTNCEVDDKFVVCSKFVPIRFKSFPNDIWYSYLSRHNDCRNVEMHNFDES